MLRILVSLFLTLVCAQALADPPVRVARVAYTRGPVSFAPAGTDEWALASLNRPLVAGDRVWTEPGARDELQLGGVAVRMDGSTLLSILTLDDRALQVQLPQGTLNVRVRPGPAAGIVEVDTPNLALTIDQPGHYRVSVDPSGNTTTVRVDDGQAQAFGQNQAYTINPGQDFRFIGPDLRNVQALDPRYRDDFDRWCFERDRRTDRARAVRYVSPAMIGYEDLDDYGSWRMVPDYGNVWIPRSVPRGWAPYRDGHWAWIEPWGWTWIDDAPWGFAVTHYGRWAYVDRGWCWVPEPANAMPVYAPALVVFAAAGLFLEHDRRRGPDVAWFPLAPHEAYRPPYQASPRYLSAINFNAGNAPPANYRNRTVNGAVTAVPVNVFTRAQPVRGAGVAVPSARFAQAPLTVAPQVQAGRESVAGRSAGGHRPAQALLARPAMTRMRPAVAGAGQAPATQVPGTQAPQPVPTPGRQSGVRGQGPAIAPGPHGAGPQAMPTQIAPLPPGEGRNPHLPPGQQHGRPVGPGAAPMPVLPQGEQAGARRGPPQHPLEHQQAPAVAPQAGVPVPPRTLQESVAQQHQREPGQVPQAAPRPQEPPPGRREAMQGPHAAVPHPQIAPQRVEAAAPQAAPHREAPRQEPAHEQPVPQRPQPLHTQAAPSHPEPAHPHVQAPALRPEPAHVQAPVQRPEPPRPQAAPRQEPPRPQPAPHQEPPRPRQPEPRAEPSQPQPRPHPAEARPAPQQHQPQQAREGQAQHGHNEQNDDKH
ncbi:hypothetical protein GCM10027321_02980 [Massilia terrae]|uniref:FecR protein n=1 Tax=Massilia terrae TaxID=1811224 RepID=A0ABT2CW55_9BURK|nr:DUF6600 domain-containing protein [Massilia terrae]MCS0657338.1 hypothetical protein [Massilia terrae]